MSPRRSVVVVAAFAVALVAVGGVAYVRIADVHAPPNQEPIDPDAPPQEIIDRSNEQFHHVDHRTVARVYLVEEDERTLRYVLEDAYDYSDRQYVVNYAEFNSSASPEGRLPYHLHYKYLTLMFMDTETYFSEVGHVAGDPEDSFAVGNYSIRNPRDVNASGLVDAPGYYQVAYQGNVFLDHEADWQVVRENETTLVLGIDDPYEYYETRQMWNVEDVHEESSIRVYVDKERGYVTRIVEDRVVTRSVFPNESAEKEVPRRFHYRIVTDVRDFGTLDLERPEGAPPKTLGEYLEDFLEY